MNRGPKRESRVTLVYPNPANSDAAAAASASTAATSDVTKSPGWTVVVENGISFGFDITKVMFCSGNVTERMRAGRICARGQVVVDLYCGIGYYTLPYLVHCGAGRVHACEWNPHSVAALRVNLEAAQVANRCVIYEGDNAAEATQTALANIADRVSLGLLPSSTSGWPLAVNALKCSGGVVHVHENVPAKNIEQWVQSCCAQFKHLFERKLQHYVGVGMEKGCVENYSQQAGATVSVTCTHIERVKSYAPRVTHIVADLTIIANSI